jgi:hypothetical protein
MKFVTRRPLITVWLGIRVLPGPHFESQPSEGAEYSVPYYPWPASSTTLR